LQAELQHPKESIQSLEKAAAIGNVWRNDLVFHGRAKLETESTVCSTLERVLNRATIADGDLQSIRDLLMTTNLSLTKQIITFQRCMALSHAKMLQGLAGQVAGYRIWPMQWFLDPIKVQILYRDQDLLIFLDWDQCSSASINLPVSNAIPALAEMEQRRNKFSKMENRPLNRYFLSAFKMDHISLLISDEFAARYQLASEASVIAQVRITRAAIAVERWRLAHNDSLPDSLVQLVPDFLSAIPTDPFDEQPLRYKKLPHGYKIYSIGPDFTDDGSKEKPSDARESDHYDITFTVER
jgi:hypothetical protein